MKKYLVLIVIAIFALTSCDKDNEGALYEPATDYVAFVSPTVVDLELTADNGYSVNCQVVRSSTKGQLTADVALEMTDDINGVFKLESNTVTFEDGKAEAYVKIISLVEPSKLDPAKKYTFKLSVTGENASQWNSTCSYTASLKVDYTAAGNGTFTSLIFEDSWEVEVLKAELGAVTLYKAVGLYEAGKDIAFMVKDGVVTVAGQKAWDHSKYGTVYVEGTGALENGVIKVTLTHFVPGVGAFGDFAEELVLP